MKIKVRYWQIAGLLCITMSICQFQFLTAQSLEQIAVTGMPSQQAITLRWAPMTYQTWRQGNDAGYRIERYVLTRNSIIVELPEKLVLVDTLKPAPLSWWERHVHLDQYAAIAAQAFFGDRFEVDLKQKDMFTIVNKVRENEQRFAFAVFSADMSPMVARASGLWFKDTTVVKGEKYLYRVMVNVADTVRGSIFMGPDDPYQLNSPQNFQGKFEDNRVSLKWDRAGSSPYTAYIVERSADGKVFTSISDTPMVTVSPTEQQDSPYAYALDSLPDPSATFYYRVKGVTPFGEKGPPSEVVSGTGIPAVEQVPYILSAENLNNSSTMIQWEFPESSDRAIAGFEVQRASAPKEKYHSINGQMLGPRERIFVDTSPGPVNYYRVQAHGLQGKVFTSPVFFAQLVDSIPPGTPVGFAGKVDDNGNVILAWDHNDESDLYGYRIYKAFNKTEEFAQLTTAPVAQPTFTDQVNLNTLNEHVYYRVMAIDINQNHSALTPLLKISLPDKVRPQPPVLLPLVVSADGIVLSWLPGASEDIVRYKIFRKDDGETYWAQVDVLEAGSDSLYAYTDKKPRARTTYYTVLSVDDADLESDPASPISSFNIAESLPPSVQWKKPAINAGENRVILKWSYPGAPAISFRIFRAMNGAPPILFKTLHGTETEYTDTIIPGRSYSYRIMAIFPDGGQSMLSDELNFQY